MLATIVPSLHAADLLSAGSSSDGWGRLIFFMVSAAALAAVVILPLLVGWTFHMLYAALSWVAGRR